MMMIGGLRVSLGDLGMPANLLVNLGRRIEGERIGREWVEAGLKAIGVGSRAA